MTIEPILLITHEPLEPRLAGPAIRAWHLAHELGRTRPVKLGTPLIRDINSLHPAVELVEYDRATGNPLGEIAQRAAVVIASGFLLRRYPALSQAGAPLVVDLYDPFVLENLEIHASKPLAEQVAVHQSDLAVLNDQLLQGDYFICASESQRDFWLGSLMAQGRINPQTLNDDPTLRCLIDVVPFGLAADSPQEKKGAIKGRVPGIGHDDRVIYWGGGIWDWFDPLTLIRAVADIANTRGDVRLFFAGVQHPSPDVPSMRMCQAAIELSDSLGLTGRVVFFNDWVPYQERGAYLLEADLGVSLHFAHVETRFSFRTRLLDYLWAGLPMVVTQGDTISEWVQQHNLGRVVRPGDVDSVRDALLEMLDLPTFRAQAEARFAPLRDELRWANVVEPLAGFCAQPHFSADRDPSRALPPTLPIWKRAWKVLRAGGLGAMVQETRSYLAWRLGKR